MTDYAKIISAAAIARGFAMVGFTRLSALENRSEFFANWLADGRHATMAYLARDPSRRIDPRVIDNRLRSVVSLAWPYPATRPPEIDWRKELRGRIAAYALGPDYHDPVLDAAKSVAAILTSECGATAARTYVDTGPVFEREWATRGGLGWFGKNTMLLNHERGSYFFLAEIFTDLEFDAPPAPYLDHCGTCRRCLRRCPTGALEEGYKIEPRLCISYLTIEHRGVIAREVRAKIGQWLFGCDICNEVCPFNDGAAGSRDLTAMPYLPDLLELDAAAFSARFRHSAIKRTKRRGLLRNAAIVLGNTGNRDAIAPLTRTLESEAEPLVRTHAAWALGRLGGRRAHRALEAAMTRETDAEVAAEAAWALAHLEA